MGDWKRLQKLLDPGQENRLKKMDVQTDTGGELHTRHWRGSVSGLDPRVSKVSEKGAKESQPQRK